MLQCGQSSKMPAGLVQDGFPQQRSCSDRLPGSNAWPHGPSRFPTRSHPISLTPPLVAAGASSRTMKIETLTVDFTDEQKRYLEGFTTGLQISRVGRGLGGANAGKANAEPSRARCRAHQGAGQGHGLRQETRRPGKVQARRASVRCLSAAEAAGARQRAADPGGQFPLALLRPVLRGAGAGFLHVPLTDPERHHEALAVGRPGRSRRKTVRAVLPRHHARQPAGARDSAEERGGADRGHSGSRPVLARHRRRQYPQRHGHADGRDRSAGAVRHPRICPRVALSHPQRSLAVRAAAQVQRRLRRRRQDRGAGGHQRHRVFRGRGEGRFWRRARRLVSPRARRHHRPQGFRQIRRHHRQAGGCDEGVRRHRARLHRSRRPHQPQQGAAEIRARRDGPRQVSRRWSRSGSASPSPACRRKRSRRGRRSIAWRISACTSRSRRG